MTLTVNGLTDSDEDNVSLPKLPATRGRSGHVDNISLPKSPPARGRARASRATTAKVPTPPQARDISSHVGGTSKQASPPKNSKRTSPKKKPPSRTRRIPDTVATSTNQESVARARGTRAGARKRAPAKGKIIN